VIFGDSTLDTYLAEQDDILNSLGFGSVHEMVSMMEWAVPEMFDEEEVEEFSLIELYKNQGAEALRSFIQNLFEEKVPDYATAYGWGEFGNEEGHIWWHDIRATPTQFNNKNSDAQELDQPSMQTLLETPPSFWRDFLLYLRILDPECSQAELMDIAIRGERPFCDVLASVSHVTDEVRVALALGRQ